MLSFLYSTKNCKSDITCFDRALSNERPAKLLTNEDGNFFQYTLKDCAKDYCNVEIKILKIREGSSQELVTLIYQ